MSLTEIINPGQDTFISSDKPTTNENDIALLNVGRAENGSINIALLKPDLGILTGNEVIKAELCLTQIYSGLHSSDYDVLYLHEAKQDWNEITATWENMNPLKLGEKVGSRTFPSSQDNSQPTEVCIQMNAKRFMQNPFGYILKGEELLDKHDRWFKSSESIDADHRPKFKLVTKYNPNLVQGENGIWKTPAVGANSIGLIVGGTIGAVALVLVGVMALVIVRKDRLRRLEEEESSIESEEEEKDFVDNLGEVFGVVSSSDDESTFNTRETTVYDGHDVIEVEHYNNRPTVGQRVQNALFGVPEEETYITDDSSYISRWYRNNRR